MSSINILITSAGRRVSLLRAFKNELKSLFPEAKVFASDANLNLSAAVQIADDAFQTPKVTDANFIDSLIDICIENNIKIVIPTIDTELSILSDNITAFEAKGIEVVVSKPDFIKVCADKTLTHKFFNSYGINTAKEYTKENYKFPLFIKPKFGSNSVGNFIIEKESDFKKTHFSTPNLLFLEYIDTNLYDEFTCDAYYDKNHNLKCVVPRKRISIRGGEVCKGVTLKNTLYDLIFNTLSSIDGARGCITFQFFVHKENSSIVAIEINARFGGGYPLSYASGANFPKWIIQEYILNEPVKNFEGWENNLLMLRYDQEILVKDFGE